MNRERVHIGGTDYRIRPALPTDAPEIAALLPRLAAFELPPARLPEQLWRGYLTMLQAWAGGERSDVHALVAEADNGTIAGAALFSLGEELLSQEPAAHLEVLVVARPAESHGLGRELALAAERGAHALGARCMTLHVFANNRRARRLYDRLGYDGELVRYIKRL